MGTLCMLPLRTDVGASTALASGSMLTTTQAPQAAAPLGRLTPIRLSCTSLHEVAPNNEPSGEVRDEPLVAAEDEPLAGSGSPDATPSSGTSAAVSDASAPGVSFSFDLPFIDVA